MPVEGRFIDAVSPLRHVGADEGHLMPIVVNGAFRPQRVTGQQRYAREIADRLVTMPGVVEVAPSGRWAHGTKSVWAWTQLDLPRQARSGTVVSLTSRSPVLHRRQVVTVHDLFPITHPEWYSPRYVALHSRLLRHHLLHARTIIAVSHPVAEQVRAYSTDRSRDVIVAPNAASEVFSRPPTSAAAAGHDAWFERDLASMGAVGLFLSVASLEPRKNLALVLRAHRKLPADIRTAYPLVLTGATAHSFRAVDLVLHDEVHLLDYVSDDRLVCLYDAATAVVSASLDEGFGLPLVEAAARRCPILVSDIPVYRWVCQSSAQYFDATDDNGLRDLMVAASAGGVVESAPIADRFSWYESVQSIYAAAGNLARG